MEVKLSQVGPVGFITPIGLFSLVGHLPRSKVPCWVIEAPVGYHGGVIDFMVSLLFVLPSTHRKLMGTEEPLASLCHFKSLTRTSLTIVVICKEK